VGEAATNGEAAAAAAADAKASDAREETAGVADTEGGVVVGGDRVEVESVENGANNPLNVLVMAAMGES